MSLFQAPNEGRVAIVLGLTTPVIKSNNKGGWVCTVLIRDLRSVMFVEQTMRFHLSDHLMPTQLDVSGLNEAACSIKHYISYPQTARLTASLTLITLNTYNTEQSLLTPSLTFHSLQFSTK